MSSYNRQGAKNPNFKDGSWQIVEKQCLICSTKFRGIDKKIFCSSHCHNLNQKFTAIIKKRRKEIATLIAEKILHTNQFYTRSKVVDIPLSERQKERELRLSNGLPELKIYYCTVCNKAEVKRKTKFCETCKPRAKVYSTICKQCGKAVNKWDGAKFCDMGCYSKYKVGEGNPNYIDGRNPESKRIRASPEYKLWRTSVFTRDKYICQHCGQIGGQLHADHIKQFAHYPELRLDINNGRTLCVSCHKKTDTYMKGKKKIIQ